MPKLFLLLLLVSGSAAAVPESFEAHYSFIAKGMVLGETRYKLEKIPAKKGQLAQYRFSTHTEPTGLAALMVDKIIDEESFWKWQDGELRPLYYRYEQKGKKQKLRTRDFNWTERQVIADDNGQQTTLQGLQPGTVDEALFMVALMRDLKSGKHPLRYPVIRKGAWSHYEFHQQTEEQITVPAGTFQALPILRNGNSDRTFQLWAAASLDYLPVQVEYRDEDGKRFLLKLKSTTLLQR